MRTELCVILLAIGLVVTSCQPDNSTEKGSNEQIRIWYLYGVPAIDEFVSEASAELSNASLSASWKPCTALELQALANSKEPYLTPDILPDIIIVPTAFSDLMARIMGSRDKQRSLDTEISQAIESCRFQGGATGHPLFCDMRQVLFNTNVVRVVAEDVDCITWAPEDECIAPQVLLSTIDSGVSSSVAAPWGTVLDNTHTMADIITSWMKWFGASIVDSLGRPVLIHQQSINALTSFAELSREGIIDTERHLQSMFLQGQLGMYVGRASIVRRMNAGSTPKVRMMPLCGLIPSQTKHDYLTVTMATVTKHCRDSAAADLVLKTLKSFVNERFQGGFPTTASFWKEASQSKDSQLRTIAARVARSDSYRPCSLWTQASEVVTQAYVRTVLGEAEPRLSLERAQGELREILMP